jgi:hypothetical protein
MFGVFFSSHISSYLFKKQLWVIGKTSKKDKNVELDQKTLVGLISRLSFQHRKPGSSLNMWKYCCSEKGVQHFFICYIITLRLQLKIVKRIWD